VLVMPALSACESTQSRSARLRKAAKSRVAERGLEVTKLAAGVKVASTALVSDPNGTALVVELRNTSRRALAAVPIAVDLADGGGASVYKNDAPGLETSLTSAALLPPRRSTVWVDDQVTPSGTPKRVRARAGAGGRVLRARAPQIVAAAPKLEDDPTSGLAAVGRVVNRSKVDQRDLVVNVVARKGRRIVAAGRAVVRRLKAGAGTRYQAFLIGKAKGAQLEASAPPTTFK
jgi:hypothetical protein